MGWALRRKLLALQEGNNGEDFFIGQFRVGAAGRHCHACGVVGVAGSATFTDKGERIGITLLLDDARFDERYTQARDSLGIGAVTLNDWNQTLSADM